SAAAGFDSGSFPSSLGSSAMAPPARITKGSTNKADIVLKLMVILLCERFKSSTVLEAGEPEVARVDPLHVQDHLARLVLFQRRRASGRLRRVPSGGPRGESADRRECPALP